MWVKLTWMPGDTAGRYEIPKLCCNCLCAVEFPDDLYPLGQVSSSKIKVHIPLCKVCATRRWRRRWIFAGVIFFGSVVVGLVAVWLDFKAKQSASGSGWKWAPFFVCVGGLCFYSFFIYEALFAPAVVRFVKQRDGETMWIRFRDGRFTSEVQTVSLRHGREVRDTSVRGFEM